MLLFQKWGPFSDGQSITFAPESELDGTRYRILQIGVEVPQTPPMSECEKNRMFEIKINNSEKPIFYLNANDILEAGDFGKNAPYTPVVIKYLGEKSNEYACINIGYEIEDTY